MVNNRKSTRGRNIQIIHLKNKDGEYTGKTKIIRHKPVSPFIRQALAAAAVNTIAQS